MSIRELVVLGTACQVPTRERAPNGYLLRWEGTDVLVDPGEGTQRQLGLAGEPVTRLRQILITHAHGDHCLGLPGILQRLSLDGVRGPVDVRFPSAATTFVERLHHASLYHERTLVRLVPTGDADDPVDVGPFAVRGVPLSHGAAEHPVPTLGWRLEEPDGRRFDAVALERRGVPPAARSELAVTGHVTVGGRRVTVEEVSRPRPGQVVAVVMDTRDGDGARACADGADLLIVEATYLDEHRHRAEEVGHLTAAQAATIAREAGARRTVLTHLSRRYPSGDGHAAEAAAAAPGLDLVVASDLDRIPLPPRR